MNTLEIAIPKDQVLKLYKSMQIIRHFEERAMELFKRMLIRGTVHPSIGQEAIAVGTCSNLFKTDYVLSTYRGHGHCIAKGANINKMMAELLGKSTGYCKGKGGSMHICDTSIGYLGANGIVGAGIPIAGGVSLGCIMRREGQVTVVFFGDGAANQGVFHETANMVGIWKLPLIMICENNGYALSVPFKYASSIPDISIRAKGYGFSGVTVNGNDLNQVYSEVSKAVKKAREGGGPSLIECKTYRWERHSVLSRAYHVDPKEANLWKENDPILRYRNWLITNQLLNKTMDDELQKEVHKLIDEATDYAISSPEPKSEDAIKDLF